MRKTLLPLRARNDHPRDYRCGATREGQLECVAGAPEGAPGFYMGVMGSWLLYGRPPKVPSFWVPEATKELNCLSQAWRQDAAFDEWHQQCRGTFEARARTRQ